MTTARAPGKRSLEEQPAALAERVFRAHGLSKIYRLGDVEVHALRVIADFRLHRIAGKNCTLGYPA